MQNRLLCILSIIIYFIAPCFAQKYDYQWIHGLYYTGNSEFNFIVDFKNFPPVIRTADSKFQGDYTTVSMSDKMGNFEFYSNGCQLSNSNYNLVENGDSLVGSNFYCYSSGHGYNLGVFHGAFALPDFQGNQFIQFSHEYKYPSTSGNYDCDLIRLLYHTIDMNANQGLGKVMVKNKTLMEGCFQVAAANRHANGRDWWILAGDNRIPQFYRWLLTPSGIQGPWIQEMANPVIDGYWFCGWTEFSPDGQRYMVNGCRTGVAIYDFDRCTGLLSNPEFLKRTGAWNFSAIFSPDSRLLYAVDKSGRDLLQFDLTAANVDASRQVIASWDGFVDTINKATIFTFMQYGPDGKIYTWAGDSYFMHVIDYPNRNGQSCHMRQRAIQLPKPAFAANLYYPHYRLGPLDGSSCDTLSINNQPHAEYRYDLSDSTQALALQFTDVSWYKPDLWYWDFGDNVSGGANTSVEQNPIHTFSKSGIYTVCLIASNQNASDTICKEVKVGISSVYTLPMLPQAEVYPNPVADVLTIALPALMPSHILHLVLTDALGRMVREVALSNFETEVEMAGLPTGMYFWQLNIKGETLQTGKVVKM